LKVEHGRRQVMHVGEHHRSAQIIRSFGPAAEPIKTEAAPAAFTAPTQAPAPAVPPAFEHLEAVERLCPVIVDTFVKHGS